MLSKHMTLTRAGARQQEETGETGREGRGSCKKDFPREMEPKESRTRENLRGEVRGQRR